MSITNILVPFDGSSYSIKAFNVAVDIAKKHGAKINVMTCLEKANLGAWYINKNINKKIIKDARKFATGFLLKLEKKANDAGVLFSFQIPETKSISKQIVNFANSKNIDLIVMGSHGRTGFSQFLLGSVSNNVSQSARCPVLIIK
ncbi:MAG: universal stress protein [Nitrosarchaeum sp.]|nr:universal stress protein [Nitrosarchaeum sp.]